MWSEVMSCIDQSHISFGKTKSICLHNCIICDFAVELHCLCGAVLEIIKTCIVVNVNRKGYFTVSSY